MASSTGKEVSGAFSHAILEGLDGKADADNNGIVGVSELLTFVSRHVPKITDGRQHPTLPVTENLRDFPIAFNQ